MYRGHSAEHLHKLLVAMSKVSYLISRVHMGTCVTPLTEKWREDFFGGMGVEDGEKLDWKCRN